MIKKSFVLYEGNYPFYSRNGMLRLHGQNRFFILETLMENNIHRLFSYFIVMPYSDNLEADLYLNASNDELMVYRKATEYYRLWVYLVVYNCPSKIKKISYKTLEDLEIKRVWYTPHPLEDVSLLSLLSETNEYAFDVAMNLYRGPGVEKDGDIFEL